MFVVNQNAIAFQQKNGIYITEYVPVSSTLVREMIIENESIGCYQQGYRTGCIKWICFDFDCKDKQSPNVSELYEEVVKPFTIQLVKHKISFLTEFSGRRGIHVWIIFDSILKKSLGYKIAKEIEKKCLKNFLNNKWHLDLFPATHSSLGNKVGLQVKFPLSVHKSGSRSFFFSNDFKKIIDTSSNDFFESQLDILAGYRENNVENVVASLSLDDTYNSEYKFVYHKYKLINIKDITVNQIWDSLSDLSFYNELHKRMRKGKALNEDWLVLFGTLSPCDRLSDIVKEVFREFPNYDEELTNKKIDKLKGLYFPATLGYLYRHYGMKLENGVDPNDTGFTYILKKFNIPEKVINEYSSYNEVSNLSNIEYTVTKEINYLLYNDESPDIYILSNLELLKKYDRESISMDYSQAIIQGYCNKKVENFRIFKRIESDDKCRYLVSLSAYDRVLTTHIALNLFYKLPNKSDSYSYRPSLTSKQDIFFSWFRAWNDYIGRLRSVLRVPLFKKFSIMYIDLKGFYEHIDFLTVFSLLKKEISEELNKEISEDVINLFNYLIGFNDSLMSQINNGKRIGVPQGPAYARIIAELFLDKIINMFTSSYKENVKIIRYVDDIVIICEPDFDGQTLYNELCNRFTEYGLEVNYTKSCFFGKIADLSEDEKKYILHSDSFDYDLNISSQTDVKLNIDLKNNLRKYLSNHDFDINSLGYIYGNSTQDEAKQWYFNNYRKKIIGNNLGRGSNYQRFYRYLFSNDAFLNVVLEEKLLNKIPLNSINFSNFIDGLYLSVKNNEISRNNFKRIKQEYLSCIDKTVLEKNDRAVVDALSLIDMLED